MLGNENFCKDDYSFIQNLSLARDRNARCGEGVQRRSSNVTKGINVVRTAGMSQHQTLSQLAKELETITVRFKNGLEVEHGPEKFLSSKMERKDPLPLPVLFDNHVGPQEAQPVEPPTISQEGVLIFGAFFPVPQGCREYPRTID